LLYNFFTGQTYTVLSLCRVLYTLEYGTVASKPVAARWAQHALDDQWRPLSERGQDGTIQDQQHRQTM